MTTGFVNPNWRPGQKVERSPLPKVRTPAPAAEATPAKPKVRVAVATPPKPVVEEAAPPAPAQDEPKPTLRRRRIGR